MNYISTRNSSNSFKFKDVFIKGLADYGGLFIPKTLHKYNNKDLDTFKNLEYNELAKKRYELKKHIGNSDYKDIIGEVNGKKKLLNPLYLAPENIMAGYGFMSNIEDEFVALTE